MVSQFRTEKQRVIDEIDMVKKTPLMKGKTVIPGRFFAIYHDAWKSAFDVAFLALSIASSNPWTFWEELKL